MISIHIDYLYAGGRLIISNLCASTEGQSLAFHGPIASGKSLLSRALCGDFTESESIKIKGTLRYENEEIEIPITKEHQATIGRSAYLPQLSSAFFVTPSTLDEISLSTISSATSSSAAERAISQWQTNSVLANRHSVHPLALSGGQQRLLMLESSLITRPRRLIMDGGIASLDRDRKMAFADQICAWLSRDPNNTFIYLGHLSELDWFPFNTVCSLRYYQSNLSNSLAIAPTSIDRREPPLIAFDNIVVGPIAERRPLLDGISCSIFEGEILGVTGKNGVGKTTLFRLLSGVRRPVSGRIWFRGQLLENVFWNGIRNGVAYLPQEPELGRGGFSEPALNATEIEWRSVLGEDDPTADVSFWVGSTGERSVRVLAQLASQRPACWILDEPTTRFNETNLLQFVNRLKASDPNISVVIITHSQSLLDRCDRVVEIYSDRAIEISPN